MPSNAVHVRPAQTEDRHAFLEMWADFVALAPSEPGDRSMGDRNWARILDADTPLECIVAVDAHGTQLGFVLFLAFPFTWSNGDVCYLQDIYVRAESRGKGVAQAMIDHLHAIGQEAGWFKIFWMTQSDNYPAQRLYEKVAERKDYIRYDLVVRTP